MATLVLSNGAQVFCKKKQDKVERNGKRLHRRLVSAFYLINHIRKPARSIFKVKMHTVIILQTRGFALKKFKLLKKSSEKIRKFSHYNYALITKFVNQDQSSGCFLNLVKSNRSKSAKKAFENELHLKMFVYFAARTRNLGNGRCDTSRRQSRHHFSVVLCLSLFPLINPVYS